MLSIDDRVSKELSKIQEAAPEKTVIVWSLTSHHEQVKTNS